MTYSEIQQYIENKLPSGTGNITADNHRDVENALLDFAKNIAESQWLPGDIKQIDCTNAYITQNFDANGIGINERAGWAICNGHGGLTKNRAGRVSVAYGTGYTTLGAIDGSKDAVAVSHFHHVFSPENTATSAGPVGPSGFPVPGSGGTGWGNLAYQVRESQTIPTLGKTNTAGVSGTDKNMQPYIVTLFIQKL